MRNITNVGSIIAVGESPPRWMLVTRVTDPFVWGRLWMERQQRWTGTAAAYAQNQINMKIPDTPMPPQRTRG